MNLNTSDWIALAALLFPAFSLVVSLFKDYFTSRDQKIEQAIDRHVQEKMSQAQHRIAESMEQEAALADANREEAAKPFVTAIYRDKRIHFLNNGQSKAISVCVTITDSQSGRSPFVDLDTMFDIEPNATRAFHCTQTSSTIKRPFTIDITWSDASGREYQNVGVTIAD